jgi:Zn finger protein HypA/HybF involved in hydrogenase expression
MTTRQCRECKSTFPIEQFPNAGVVKGIQYYRHLCTSCYSSQKTNKTKERMQKFREYKKTLKCNRCGYDDYRALQFHHTDDNKEGTPSVIARYKSWDNVMEELNKCEVLCANCHQIEHYIGV